MSTEIHPANCRCAACRPVDLGRHALPCSTIPTIAGAALAALVLIALYLAS